jgi:hypothetical protein
MLMAEVVPLRSPGQEQVPLCWRQLLLVLLQVRLLMAAQAV